MNAGKIILGAVAIIIGLLLLPLMAGFVEAGKNNTSTKAIAGLPSVLDLIVYGFTFGLVGIGVGMIYMGFKK
jgi:hypothetical protein